MGFQDAVRSVFRQYAIFAGRACRSEYWWFWLFNVVVTIVALILDRAIFGGDPGISGSPLEMIWNLVTLLPGLAVTVRRLHDVGRAGWWILLGIVPLVGWIVLLIWAVRRGDSGPNAYGPDPLGSLAAAPFAA
jgi:uncharacterized membrane protein YhaH (DUF805 family)